MIIDSVNGPAGVEKAVLDQMVFLSDPAPLHVELIILYCSIKEIENVGYLYHSDTRCAITVPYRIGKGQYE